MNMFNGFRHHAAFFAGTLLLNVCFAAHADGIQDANKLFKQGQHVQALDEVNGFLDNNPKDAQARFLKGLIYTEQGKTTDAIKMFLALTVDYPELPEPYNNLAVLYASQNQYDKAKLALEMAIRTHPSYATAHENLGDIYAKLASQAYDRALQLDRSNTATQTKLAMIQDLFGDASRVKAISPGRPPAPAIASEQEKKTDPVATKLTPEEKSAEPAPAAPNSSEVLKTIHEWAAAWSSQNFDSYQSFYADDFNTPNGESRTDWFAARKLRISTPKSIHIDISNATVKFNDRDHATVKFRQSYHANHLKTSGNKTLLMVRSGDKWQIQEERAR